MTRMVGNRGEAGRVILTVVKEEGLKYLVFAHTDHGTVAMSPVLGCTLNAIHDLVTAGDNDDRAYIECESERSLHELVEACASWADRKRGALLNYTSSGGLPPQDYVAIAALLIVFKEEI